MSKRKRKDDMMPAYDTFLKKPASKKSALKKDDASLFLDVADEKEMPVGVSSSFKEMIETGKPMVLSVDNIEELEKIAGYEEAIEEAMRRAAEEDEEKIAEKITVSEVKLTPSSIKEIHKQKGVNDLHIKKFHWVHNVYGCCIKRHPFLGSLNGYVDVNVSHPLFGVTISDIRLSTIDIHKGIDHAMGYEKFGETYWRIGFSTSYAEDFQPLMEPLLVRGEYKNFDYVYKLTNKLADMLRKIEVGEVERLLSS